MLRIETDGTVTYDTLRIGEVMLDNPARDYLKIPARDYLKIGGTFRVTPDTLIDEAQFEIEGLSERNTNLQDQVTHLDDELAGRDDEIAELKSERSDLEQQAETLGERIAALEREKSDLQRKAKPKPARPGHPDSLAQTRALLGGTSSALSQSPKTDGEAK